MVVRRSSRRRVTIVGRVSSLVPVFLPSRGASRVYVSGMSSGDSSCQAGYVFGIEHEPGVARKVG